MTNKHSGLHPHRLKDNPEERAFAEAWERHQVGHTIAYLLDTEQGKPGWFRPAEPSDRDCTVAATLIQWLGSPVGQGFLRDLGYEKVRR